MMFTELKCKTNFSFLRGASSAGELIEQAVRLGMDAIAMTDINGVYAVPRAFEKMKELGSDIKLIVGSEITVLDHSPITLLAKDRAGYGLLCRLITAVHAGKEKGEGFITLSQIAEMLESFPGRSGLVCLAEADANLEILKALFPENLYLTLCRYLDGLDGSRTDKVLNASLTFGLPVVATNDVHYHTSSRRPLQDCMTCIREGKTLDNAGFLLFGNHERYLKNANEMADLFSDYPEALLNTQKIKNQCVFHLSELKYSYPHEFIPEGHTPGSYLRKLVFEGAEKIYNGNVPAAARAQIERELAFFKKRGDEHYFLTVQDIVRFANEKNIICQGRGSAANSIVCYVLGITSVDPIQMNLLFDRFMNDGRKEPPDIDIDFEHERREEVIQYIYERFGRDRAAMVTAVRTYRSRSAFIELSKAVGIELGTISAGELGVRFDELAGDKKDRRFFIEELSQQMKKFPRHLSIHSGGFVLSDSPLVEMVPVEPARMENRTIIQWDKDDLETMGLMKIDVLSIGFLTALHKACDLVGMKWTDIKDNDVPTYKMIQRAETHGTFQIESRAQINMLRQTLPENYYDLVVQVALVRPSPTEGGMVQPYIKGLFEARRGRPFDIGNLHLNRILGRTHGVPIFQEQIMQISIDVAKFSPSDADKLRRSLGLQRSAEGVDVMAKKLYDALISQNIPKAFADKLFQYIKGYAHYGFPESHAASYASLAYKSAYMKCHHPAALVCALINSQPMGFYSVDALVAEAKREGVKFLPLDPNKSFWDATLEKANHVRMGFRNLKHVREDDVKTMLEQRKKKEFESLEDFIFRTGFSKETLENFAIADVFAVFGVDRRHSFWQSIEFTNLCNKNEFQETLFNDKTKTGSSALFKQMKLLEEIQMDHRKLGYSLHGNLMKGLREEIPGLPKLTSAELKKLPAGREVVYAGILMTFQRPPPAKGTAFMTLEDEFGTVDTVVRKEVYEKYEHIIQATRFLVFAGKIQRRGTGTTFLVEKIGSFARKRSAKVIGPQQDMGTLSW